MVEWVMPALTATARRLEVEMCCRCGARGGDGGEHVHVYV